MRRWLQSGVDLYCDSPIADLCNSCSIRNSGLVAVIRRFWSVVFAGQKPPYVGFAGEDSTDRRNALGKFLCRGLVLQGLSCPSQPV